MSTGERHDPAPPVLPALQAACERLGLALDERALERFARYLALLVEWNERAGLTAVTDPDEVQRRHFAESLALLVALRGAGVLTHGQPATLVDLGSGAGFPGLPLAIAEPALRVALIESHGRRAQFLATVVDALGLANVQVVHARAEQAGHDPALRGTFDVATARAVASLAVLVEYALPLLRPGGVLAAPKGSRAVAELAEAAHAIAMLGGHAEPSVPLALPPDAPPQQVLMVRRTGPLDARYPRRAGMPEKRPL